MFSLIMVQIFYKYKCKGISVISAEKEIIFRYFGIIVRKFYIYRRKKAEI